jgi:hypothetical protein
MPVASVCIVTVSGPLQGVATMVEIDRDIGLVCSTVDPINAK